MTVNDIVRYENLIPGKSYIVEGKLMDQATGEPFLADGKEVTASKQFTAEKADGEVILTFTFDGSALAGKSLVAFETVKYEGKEVAVHADLNDKGQTVSEIQILTETETEAVEAEAPVAETETQPETEEETETGEEAEIETETEANEKVDDDTIYIDSNSVPEWRWHCYLVFRGSDAGRMIGSCPSCISINGQSYYLADHNMVTFYDAGEAVRNAYWDNVAAWAESSGGVAFNICCGDYYLVYYYMQ